MDKAKRIQIANNKIKRIMERMATMEFHGDEGGYAELENQLIKANEKLEDIKVK